MTYRELLQKLKAFPEEELDLDVMILHDMTYYCISCLTTRPEKDMWYTEAPEDAKFLEKYPVLLTSD